MLAAGFPVHAQVTRVDTVNYPATQLPKRAIQTFNTDYLYTIGVKLYGYEQFLPAFNQTSDDTYYNTYVNGLMLGFNNNQMTYRLQASHFRKDSNGGHAFGKLTNTAIKMGFQYHLNYQRIQPYLGTDIGVMIQRYRSGYTATEESVSITERIVAPLASPFVGVRVFIIPKLSVAAEANFNVAYSTKKTSGGIDGDRTKHAWDTFFSPVAGITLQYHFGSLTY